MLTVLNSENSSIQYKQCKQCETVLTVKTVYAVYSTVITPSLMVFSKLGNMGAKVVLEFQIYSIQTIQTYFWIRISKLLKVSIWILNTELSNCKRGETSTLSGQFNPESPFPDQDQEKKPVTPVKLRTLFISWMNEKYQEYNVQFRKGTGYS